MSQLSAGQQVKIKVVFKMNDGTVIPASPDDQPLEMVVGQDCGFKAIDENLPNMSMGETKVVNLQPEDAFGMPDPNLVMDIPRNEIDADSELAPGMHFELQTPQGQIMPAIVHEVSDSIVRVDANHPLAGEELECSIEIVG